MAIDPTPQTSASTPQPSEAKGIFQSDILARAALLQGIRELRAHPYLLDYCFAHLVDDELTAASYGAREREKAKRWFLRTDIPVVMDYRQGAPEGTQVSIALVDSTEAESTLADIHYQPTEDVESIWPVLAGPFAAASYVASTGTVTLPPAVADDLVVVPSMLLFDSAGRKAEVLTTIDRQRFTVAAGTQLDLSKAVLRGAKPALIQSLESVEFKEVYRIGAHAIGEPYMLTWLHTIVVFILLRYKQELMEARGFERSVLSSAPFAKDERWPATENLWTRFVTVSGYARSYWPKRADRRITTVTTNATFERVNEDPVAVTSEPGFAAGTEPWDVQDGDGIGLPIRDDEE
jgi:hypothetical protein